MKLSENQISFLSVGRSSKNKAWAVRCGVLWSTDGQHLFAVETKKGALFSGDLGAPAAEITGSRLERTYRSTCNASDYPDPTKLIREPPESRFVFDDPGMFAETLKKSEYLKWADRIWVTPVGERTYTKEPEDELLYHFGYDSPLTRNHPHYPHRPVHGAQSGYMKEPFLLYTKVIKKILRTMDVSRIMITGTSYRDPVYFYGKVDGSNAIAVVSPIK